MKNIYDITSVEMAASLFKTDMFATMTRLAAKHRRRKAARKATKKPPTKCPDCQGTGVKADGRSPCLTCEGTGKK